MWENRSLAPAEGTLRHTSGATNLSMYPGDWFSLAPRAAEEQISLSGLEIILSGQGLLEHIEGFGGTNASFEIALHLRDRFGSVHDLAAKTLYTIETAAEWQAGTHHGTMMDPHAGNLPQEASRAGLRGADLLPGQPEPPSVSWTSPRIALSFGTDIERVVWEVDDLRDNTGNALQEYKLSFRVGPTLAGPMGEWQEVSALALLGRTECVFDDPVPSGHFAQWMVELKYSPSSGAAFDETPRRTPIIYSLGFWLRLPSHHWKFESLADLLARADVRARLLPLGWKGAVDAVLLRLPLEIELRRKPWESIHARFVLPAGTASPLDTLQIRATGSLTFEEA